MTKLEFDNQKYEIQKIVFQGEKITVRAFENIVYVEKPVDEIQKLNIYVPEEYYQGKTIHGYDIHSAPILMPNTVGGYMPGKSIRPGQPIFHKDDVMFKGLQHGYVIVSAGIRGRGLENKIGCAPACVVDYKAAVRYLRYNKNKIAGNCEKIISNGTSAGSALSSLLGSTGNHPDYEPYLQKLGAANERDDIFGASCYCPITNLDHADMVYEWEFSGLNDYIRIRHLPNHEVEKIEGQLTDEQIKMSQELKLLFTDYFNDLNLQKIVICTVNL